MEANPPRNHEVVGLITGLDQWVKDPSGVAVSCGVGDRLRLGSHVAVAVVQAGGCSSNLTPSLGIFICQECSPKMQ